MAMKVLARLRLAHLVCVDDVRVAQTRGEARFVEEHLQARAVVRVTEALDDGELVEAHGAARHREEYVRHAAMAQAREGSAYFPMTGGAVLSERLAATLVLHRFG